MATLSVAPKRLTSKQYNVVGVQGVKVESSGASPASVAKRGSKEYAMLMAKDECDVPKVFYIDSSGEVGDGLRSAAAQYGLNDTVIEVESEVPFGSKKMPVVLPKVLGYSLATEVRLASYDCILLRT